MTRKLLFTLILLVVVLGISGLALTQAASGAEENKPPATADRSHAAQSSAKPDGDYVGTDVCVTCHADKGAAWATQQLRTWKNVSPWRVE